MSERNDAPPAPTRGVAIELDRTRYLRYPLKVLKQLQNEPNRTLGDILLLGLQADDPALTIEQVEDMIDLENLNTLFAPVKRATGGLIDLSRLFKFAASLSDPLTPLPAAGPDASASA